MSLGSLPLICVTWLSFTSALQKGRAMSQLFLPLPYFCLDTPPPCPPPARGVPMSPKNDWWHCTKIPENDLEFSLSFSF